MHENSRRLATQTQDDMPTILLPEFGGGDREVIASFVFIKQAGFRL